MQQLMRKYTFTYYADLDAYGQPHLSNGKMSTMMAISVISNQISDSALYRDAQYIGLTQDAISDRCIIDYGDEKLKVLYVVPGRYNQVYMARCE